MVRSLVTALLCGIAVLLADLAFRTSVLNRVRPVILTPADNAVLDADLELAWDGPSEMQVLLSRIGEESRDLGVHTSPLSVSADEFGRPGGYRVEVRHPTVGSWIAASRNIQHHGSDGEDLSPAIAVDPGDSEYLLLALDAARQSRDKARTRSRELRRENALLRGDAGRLQGKLEELYEAQDADTSHTADLENRLANLAADFRALAAENGALRLRLGSANPCTVWGYFSYPRPQTIPRTRRVVTVSNTVGDIFRDQASCEALRADDSTAASPCFCVGNTFGE